VKSVVAVAVLVGCGPEHVDTPREVARDTLGGAAGSAGDLETLFRASVVNGGLWFDDPTCTSKFAVPGEVEVADQPAFAKCLAGLHLQSSAREDALGDVTVMTYAPGIEVEARVVQELAGPHLAWIGYASHGPDDPMVPTITSAALESIRLTGDRNGPLDPQLAATLHLDPTPTSHAQYTWIKICLDQTGAIVKTHAGETTSHEALVAFEGAAKAWTFKPFQMNGQPVPVCAMERLAYPPDQGPSVETLPLPPPPTKPGKHEPLVFAAGAKAIEGKRISGNKLIRPDPQTSIAIKSSQRHRSSRVTGSFRVCLDETGHVESVLPLRSTGFANYDRELLAGMQQWIYSPYTVDGQPVPACTGVTFIYMP
jgi:hypothetical protein